MKTWQFIVIAVIGLLFVGAVAANGRKRKPCGCHKRGSNPSPVDTSAGADSAQLPQ